MRKISASKIRETVAALFLKANFELRGDILRALKKAFAAETDRRAKGILASIIENAAVARKEKLAICQDTGMAIVFLEIGQKVAVTGGSLDEAVNAGVRKAYASGYLRKSVVRDPLDRVNTNMNTPSSLHVDIVDGSRIKISVAPKGFGSENKSAIRMFNPTAKVEAIEEFVLDVVKRAGPGACPPLVVGVGLGGTFEGVALLAKRSLLRRIDRHNPHAKYAALERRLFAKINKLGIGPMGLGGKTTALGVNVLSAPTHIAGLPVAVNISCHATRGAEALL